MQPRHTTGAPARKWTNHSPLNANKHLIDSESSKTSQSRNSWDFKISSISENLVSFGHCSSQGFFCMLAIFSPENINYTASPTTCTIDQFYTRFATQLDQSLSFWLPYNNLTCITVRLWTIAIAWDDPARQRKYRQSMTWTLNPESTAANGCRKL